ncbi:hypothetical protein VKT23_014909 [Stygiomarasmius scandens]|uniref:Uncharacterized protein n=1 Tax=Marasmiellus scandens TaxID=2682957 RepID=A0ABR1J446_9AGAR
MALVLQSEEVWMYVKNLIPCPPSTITSYYTTDTGGTQEVTTPGDTNEIHKWDIQDEKAIGFISLQMPSDVCHNLLTFTPDELNKDETGKAKTMFTSSMLWERIKTKYGMAHIPVKAGAVPKGEKIKFDKCAQAICDEYKQRQGAKEIQEIQEESSLLSRMSGEHPKYNGAPKWSNQTSDGPSNTKKGKGKKRNAPVQPETTKSNKKTKKQHRGGMNKRLDKKGKGKATAQVADSDSDTEMGEPAFMADVNNEIDKIPNSNNHEFPQQSYYDNSDWESDYSNSHPD